jgi:hypothetical protein
MKYGILMLLLHSQQEGDPVLYSVAGENRKTTIERHMLNSILSGSRHVRRQM